jgi:hypothetical protein
MDGALYGGVSFDQRRQPGQRRQPRLGGRSGPILQIDVMNHRRSAGYIARLDRTFGDPGW